MQAVSAHQLKQYQELGYFTVAGLLTPTEVSATCAEITRIAGRYPDTPDELIQWEPAVGDGTYTPPERELGIRKLFRVAKHNDFFRRLASHPRLLEIATAILGPSLHLVQAMTLMKPPVCSTDKVWHQDNAYFRRVPCEVFGFWIACDAAIESNGCMQIVPGSHLGGVVEHQGQGDEYGMVNSPSPEQILSVPLSPGDALIFHGELCHFTPANTTMLRRRAIQYHYSSTSCRREGGDHPFDFPLEIENLTT